MHGISVFLLDQESKTDSYPDFCNVGASDLAEKIMIILNDKGAILYQVSGKPM